MHQENRRSFVKKSLATSISLSFAGLIRAHGEESGGTTTWNPDTTTLATTDSGGTTTWNPDTTTIEVTTWNPDTTTEVTTSNPDETTVVTTTSPEPSIRKQDPVGCSSNGTSCPVIMKSVGFGTIYVSENKGGTPPVFLPRFQAKIYWIVEATLEIPKANRQSNSIIPVKAECFQCTAKSIKAYFKVEKTDGTAATLVTNIQDALNNQLRLAYNSPPNSNKFISAPDLVNGVSGTATQPIPYEVVLPPDYAEISTTYGGARETPQGNPLRMKLDATISPAQDASSKGIAWIFTLLSGPQLTAGIKGAMEAAIRTAVTSHNGGWELKAFEVPECTNLLGAPSPSQEGTAQMLIGVHPGAACNIP